MFNLIVVVALAFKGYVAPINYYPFLLQFLVIHSCCSNDAFAAKETEPYLYVKKDLLPGRTVFLIR